MIQRLFLTALLALTPAYATAQQARVPVTVALVDTWSYGPAPYTILRRADVSPHDVILLRADSADGKQLSAAVLDLVSIRGRTGNIPATTGMVRMRAQGRPTSSNRPVLPWAQRVVNDARRAEARSVPGVGTVKAVQIGLPAQPQ
jgi:hypothetical protein